jgi:hypothetical protein
MTKRRWPDPFALDIVPVMKKRGLSPDVEKLFQQIKTALEAYPKAMRRQWAAELKREIDARAAELKQCGVRDPVARAEEEVAKRRGFRSGPALNRWVRRNR